MDHDNAHLQTHMSSDEFRTLGRQFLDWVVNYLDDAEDISLKQEVIPGDVRAALPESPDVDACCAGAQVSAVAAIRGELPVALALRHAGARTLNLRYELHGPAGAPVVFVAGGISAHRHVAARLDIGKGAFDTRAGLGVVLPPVVIGPAALEIVDGHCGMLLSDECKRTRAGPVSARPPAGTRR